MGLNVVGGMATGREPCGGVGEEGRCFWINWEDVRCELGVEVG